MDALPRMRDYLEPEDLNTEACVTLAAQVMREAAEAYIHAKRRAMSSPSIENRAHLKTCEEFYRSDWFKALSCGLVDGEAVIKELNTQIEEGRR